MWYTAAHHIATHIHLQMPPSDLPHSEYENMQELGQQLCKSSCSDSGYIVRTKIALLQMVDALFSLRLIILC